MGPPNQRLDIFLTWDTMHTCRWRCYDYNRFFFSLNLKLFLFVSFAWRAKEEMKQRNWVWSKDVRFFFRSIASTSFVAFCGEFQMGMRFFLHSEIFLAFFTCFCTCEWLDCCFLESFMVSWLVFFLGILEIEQYLIWKIIPFWYVFKICNDGVFSNDLCIVIYFLFLWQAIRYKRCTAKEKPVRLPSGGSKKLLCHGRFCFPLRISNNDRVCLEIWAWTLNWMPVSF